VKELPLLQEHTTGETILTKMSISGLHKIGKKEKKKGWL